MEPTLDPSKLPAQETSATHKHSVGLWHPDCPACPDRAPAHAVKAPKGALLSDEQMQKIINSTDDGAGA